MIKVVQVIYIESQVAQNVSKCCKSCPELTIRASFPCCAPQIATVPLLEITRMIFFFFEGNMKQLDTCNVTIRVRRVSLNNFWVEIHRVKIVNRSYYVAIGHKLLNPFHSLPTFDVGCLIPRKSLLEFRLVYLVVIGF